MVSSKVGGESRGSWDEGVDSRDETGTAEADGEDWGAEDRSAEV